MDHYRIALFIHIFGALWLFAEFAFEWLALARLRRTDSRDQVLAWLGVRSLAQRIGPLAMLLLVVPGLLMTVSSWSFIGWPGAALLGMLGVVVVGVTLTVRAGSSRSC